ncbi:ADP-ribose diphosphatase [Klebsiella pneumoniae]
MSKPTQQGITFSKNDVEIIARETLYRGFFSLDLYRFRHRLFNGGMSGEITREIFERGHAAVLLPFDPVRDEVVLVEQIRIAAYDTSESPWLLEMVAGMIEARRERLSILVGEVDASTAKGIHGLAEENEDIRVHVVSREQAYQWVEEGKIDNAASVIALQWLQLHYHNLRNEWTK